MRVLDVDPFLGVVETFEYDHATDSMTITRTQDVTAIIERNKALQNITADHWKNRAKGSESGIDMRLFACIPVVVQEKWLRDHGVNIYDKDHLEAAKRLINDPDWRWMKAADVKI